MWQTHLTANEASAGNPARRCSNHRLSATEGAAKCLATGLETQGMVTSHKGWIPSPSANLSGDSQDGKATDCNSVHAPVRLRLPGPWASGQIRFAALVCKTSYP